MPLSLKVDYASGRKIRERNKPWYRVAHWPIWIWVFSLAPGPLTFALFEHGGDLRNWIWLGMVLIATGIAGAFGQLPGVEPRPYILLFSEDKPNPLYRRVCYTFAWNALLSFASLNLIGLLAAVITGRWYMKQIYDKGYLPVLFVILTLGICRVLPRARRSTKGEGTERRYFYGAVWSVTISQTLLLVLWKTLPKNHLTDIVKLCAFLASLCALAIAAALGMLPRTRPILPGEVMIAD